ncbi:FGGY-family carbohydrate kinase [Priestia filamentosa]
MYNIYIDKCTYKKYTEVVNKIKRKGKRFLSIIDIETAVKGGISVKTNRAHIKQAITKGETSLGIEFGSTRTNWQIDLVTTPNGSPVGMVHANNCSSDINAWLGLFREFSEAMGQKVEMNKLFHVLLNKALEADPDGGGLLSYGYFSGENITGLEKGRPLFVRSPESNFNLANFMRTHLFTAFGALKIGMDILKDKENVAIDSILAHGGLFKTPVVGQKIVAAAMNAPVSIMATAGEGGAWGIAILASYMMNRDQKESLEDFLDKKVFEGVDRQEIYPDSFDVKGFEEFIERYKKGLAVEQAAVDNLIL